MATPFYDLPSPDDEDERLTQEEWLATHGSARGPGAPELEPPPAPPEPLVRRGIRSSYAGVPVTIDESINPETRRYDSDVYKNGEHWFTGKTGPLDGDADIAGYRPQARDRTRPEDVDADLRFFADVDRLKAQAAPNATPWQAMLQPGPPSAPPSDKLSPVPAPSEQTTRAAQQQQALGNPDKAAQLFVQATKQGQAENNAAGNPNARPAPEIPSITNGSVAQSQRPAAQGSHGIDLEQPPEYKAPGQGAFWVALLADAFLNKGRSMGGIVSRYAALPDEQGVNYQRRMQHAKDVADLEATRRRGTLSPEEEELRQARLEIARGNLEARKMQIGQQGESLAMRQQEHYERTHPQSDRAASARAYLKSQGMDTAGLESMGYESIKASLQPALKNNLELAMGERMNALAGDKARAQAEATEASKVRTAGAISDATQENKLALVREGATIRAGEKERVAGIEEEKAIQGERRKRMVAQAREITSLESLLERLRTRDASASLPKQGHFIERGAIKLKADVLGGTGMSPEDSSLDNDLTMAGLQNYITGAGNAPNSEREQDVAGGKFRADGTVGGAIAAIEARLAEMERGESDLRKREDADRSFRPHAQRPAQQQAPAEPRQPRVWAIDELQEVTP